MRLTVENTEVNWEPKRLLIAGYTSKDQEQLQKHIKELEEELGVVPPPTTPMIYDLSPELLTINETITVVNNDTSGEVEVTAAEIDGKWYIGIGSDHTDRKLEAISIQKSKQVCGKPVSSTLWALDRIEDHWDDIELKSWAIDENGQQHLYQSGYLSEFMQPTELLEIVKERDYYRNESLVFCGTLPLITPSFIYGIGFRAELFDPVLNRKIELNYSVELLKDAEVIETKQEVK
jgi:hypothetical protein